MARKFIAVNERGHTLGEDHHNARLTNAEVDLLLELRDELDERGRPVWSYSKLAVKFEISKSAVRKICRGQTRCQTPAGHREVTGGDHE